MLFRVTFLEYRFFFVGNDSRHARQIKCLILFGTSSAQMNFQNLLCADGSDGPELGFSANSLYALVVEYLPDFVPVHMSLSGGSRELRGMPKTILAS